MKLQLRNSLQKLTAYSVANAIPRRFFASNMTTLKTATTAAANSKKNSPAKVPGVNADISKMPQPHPVLTPLARSTADQAAIDPLPAIDAIQDCEKFVYRVELDKELQKRLPKALAEVSDHFGGNVFVLRKELIEQIRNSLKDSDRMLIDGPNGSGKSVLLMQIYASVRDSIAADKDKLVLYVPNVHKWTTGYFPYYPVESADGTVYYKQPELALEILRLLLVANGPKMPEGLAERIEDAKLDAYNRALPLFEQTMRELQEEKELFVFLDGVNGLIEGDSLTGYMDREGNALPLKALPLCSKFFNRDVFRGKIIGALTHSNPALPTVSKTTTIPSVNVSNYSNEEMKRVLNLYSQLGHCTVGNKSEQFVAFKAFVSGGNGRKLYKSCEYDSIYYKHN